MPEPAESNTTRLRSLDVFRGLAVLGMLLVDFPGSWDQRFGCFNHAEWLGITLPDFIFPSFLFAMGVALTFSLETRKAIGGWRLHLRLVRRAAVLFLFGYFLNWCWDGGPINVHTLRLLGVLQRIGIVFLVASLAHLHLSRRGLLALASVILVGYALLMTKVPVPGFGKPNLAQVPGGGLDGLAPNLATWLDKTLLGARAWKETLPGDPEGILSSVSAIATGLLGVLAGRWLRSDAAPEAKVNGLFATGLLLAVTGWCWGLGFPISKKLWTSTFVLYAGGWSMMAFAALYWAIDVRGAVRFQALPRWFGRNALAAIVLCTVVDNALSRHSAPSSAKIWLHDHLFRSWLSDLHASWAYSVVFILLFALVFRTLDRRGWHLRA